MISYVNYIDKYSFLIIEEFFNNFILFKIESFVVIANMLNYTCKVNRNYRSKKIN
jgi:hypothetical protein